MVGTRISVARPRSCTAEIPAELLLLIALDDKGALCEFSTRRCRIGQEAVARGYVGACSGQDHRRSPTAPGPEQCTALAFTEHFVVRGPVADRWDDLQRRIPVPAGGRPRRRRADRFLREHRRAARGAADPCAGGERRVLPGCRRKSRDRRGTDLRGIRGRGRTADGRARRHGAGPDRLPALAGLPGHGGRRPPLLRLPGPPHRLRRRVDLDLLRGAGAGVQRPPGRRRAQGRAPDRAVRRLQRLAAQADGRRGLAGERGPLGRGAPRGGRHGHPRRPSAAARGDLRRRRRGDHLGGPGGPGERARLRAVDHADHRLRHGDGRALQQILGVRGHHLRSADGQPHRSRMRKDDRLLHQHAAAAVPGRSRGDVPGMSRGCPATVPGRSGARSPAAGGDYRRGRCAT